MKNTLIIIFTLFSLGCSFQRLEELNIGLEDPEEQALTVEALETWFEIHPEARIPYRISNEEKSSITYDPSCGEKKEKAIGYRGEHVNGYTLLRLAAPPRIRMCRSMREMGVDLFYTTVMHELGHALSSRDDHLEDGNIMQKNWNDKVPSAPTELDVEYVRGM